MDHYGRDDGRDPISDSPAPKTHRSEGIAVTRLQFIRDLPKVDLHAHLNGSIPAMVLQKMLLDQGEDEDVSRAVVLRSSELMAVHDVAERMRKCFKVFDAVYRVMTHASRMERAVFAVLDEYLKEGTAFLELRTTPRAGLILDDEPTPHDGAANATVGDATDYVVKVLQYLDAFDAKQRKAALCAAEGAAPPMMIVRLLLAVGRRMTADAAMNVVDMAVRSRDADRSIGRVPRVTGIDFSGDCYCGVWETYLPALRKAKDAGLRVSVHVGEKDDEAELAAMLAFGPDRIGHLVFAGDANTARVRDMQVPLELCITSNLLTTNWRLDEHHVGRWFELAEGGTQGGGLRHPVSINTDDRGVFDTSMTKELLLFLECLERRHAQRGPVAAGAIGADAFDDAWVAAAGALPITVFEAQALVAITRQAIRDAFVDEMGRATLTTRLDRFCNDYRASLLAAAGGLS